MSDSEFAASWKAIWPYPVIGAFADVARRTLGPAEFVDLMTPYAYRAVWFTGIVRMLREAGRPFEVLSYDGADGRLFPAFRCAGADFRSEYNCGILHADIGTADAVMLLHAELPGTPPRDYVMAAARTSDRVTRFLQEAQDWDRRRRRREDRIVLLEGQTHRLRADTRWEDILLPRDLVADIRRNVEGFFRMGEHYARRGIPHRRGFLFVGPPGNGKTSICRAVAATEPVPFVYFAAHSEADEYRMEQAFERARALAPSVLCLEDLDCLFHSEYGLSAFLNQLDGFYDNSGVLTIATTNKPEKIDPALLERPSRFDRVWRIDNPGAREREALLARLLSSAIPADGVRRVVRRTDGLSMAAVKEVYVSACLLAFDRGRDEPDLTCLEEATDLVCSQMNSARNGFDSGPAVGFAKAE